MAPTSKSSTSKGNPAPDFTLHMNRIQTQLEAGLKVARAFNPRSQPNGSSSAGSKSFSALSASTNSSTTQQAQSRHTGAPLAATRRELEEADFEEEFGLDPNAGIGSLQARKSSATAPGNGSGETRDTARLRGRLLGKRGRGVDGDGKQKWTRKEESSDEEAGRSGLGRAKIGKRSRAEMESGDKERQEDSEAKLSAVQDIEKQDDIVGGPEDEAEAVTTEPIMGDESGQPVTEGNPKKKRKKKKKKKPQDKTDTN